MNYKETQNRQRSDDGNFQNILSRAMKQAQGLDIKVSKTTSSSSEGDLDQAFIAFMGSLTRNSSFLSEEKKLFFLHNLCDAFGFTVAVTSGEKFAVEPRIEVELNKDYNQADKIASATHRGNEEHECDNDVSSFENSNKEGRQQQSKGYTEKFAISKTTTTASSGPSGEKETIPACTSAVFAGPLYTVPSSPERKTSVPWIKSPKKEVLSSVLTKLAGFVSGKIKHKQTKSGKAIDDADAFDTLLQNVENMPYSDSESEDLNVDEKDAELPSCTSDFTVEKCVKFENPTVEELCQHLRLPQCNVDQLVTICKTKQIPLSYLTFSHPSQYFLKMPYSKWEEAYDATRTKLKEGWAGIVDDCLSEIGYPCSFNADNFVKLKNDKHLLTLIGHCGGDCITKFKIKVEHPKPNKPVKLQIIPTGKFKLLQQSPTGREVRGPKRDACKTAMKFEAPYKHFLKRELKLPMMRLLHNCHRQKSLSVLQKLNTEDAEKGNAVDPATALKSVQEKLQAEPMHASSVASIESGYVRMIWRVPFGFSLYSPLQLRYAGLCDVVFLDASGNITKTIDGKKCLTHVLMGKMLKLPAVNAVPLLEFGLNKNDTERVKSMVSSFHTDATTIAPSWKPKLACCDFSFLYLHVLSEVFNKEELMVAVNRAYDRVIKNEKSKEDITDIMICKLHLLNAFRRVLVKHNVQQHIRQYAMHALAKLQEAPSWSAFQDATDRLISLFGCNNLSENVAKQYIYDMVHDNLQNPLDEETHAWEFIIKDDDALVDAVDTGLQRERSKFYQYFCQRERVILNACEDLKDPDRIGQENTNAMFNPTVVQIIRDFYYPYAGLWSRCIPRNQIPLDFAESGLLTNAPVENYFFKVKQKLHPKAFMNPALFVEDHAPLAIGMAEEGLSKAFSDVTLFSNFTGETKKCEEQDEISIRDDLILAMQEELSEKASLEGQSEVRMERGSHILSGSRDSVDDSCRDVSTTNLTHFEGNDAVNIHAHGEQKSTQVPKCNGKDNAPNVSHDSSKREFSIETWKKRTRQRRVKYLNRFKRDHFKSPRQHRPSACPTTTTADKKDVQEHYIGLQRLICRLKLKLRTNKGHGISKLKESSEGKTKRKKPVTCKTARVAKFKSASVGRNRISKSDATFDAAVRKAETSFAALAKQCVTSKQIIGTIDDTFSTASGSAIKVELDEVETEMRGQSNVSESFEIMPMPIVIDSDDEIDVPTDVVNAKITLMRVFQFPSVTGDEEDIASLAHGKWLDDTIMAGIASFLLSSKGTSNQDLFLDSFAIRTVTNKIKTDKGIVNDVKFYHSPYARLPPSSVAKPRVFHTAHFPCHWIMIVVDFEDEVFRVFDTKLGIVPQGQKTSYVAEMKKLFNLKWKMNTDSFKVVWERTPQQQGGYECGDMSLGVMDSLLCNIEPKLFFKNYSSESYREQNLEHLLKTSHNGLALLHNFSHYGLAAMKELLELLTLRKTIRSLVYENETYREKIKKENELVELLRMQNEIKKNEKCIATLLPWSNLPTGKPYLTSSATSSLKDTSGAPGSSAIVSDIDVKQIPENPLK